jgi:two-component system, sensor histidine kinase
MNVTSPTGPRDALVLAEQLRAYYATFKQAAIAGTLGPLLIAAMFWQVIPHWRIVLWWCAVAATMGVGSLLLRHYFLTMNQLPNDSERWLRLAALRSFVIALVYGSAGALLFSAESQTYQIILFAWLVAISALVTVESANHPWLYFTTLLPMLGAFILRATFHAERTALILAVSAVILLVYLLAGARKVNKLIVESLTARFANAELVGRLQAQMGIAESARAEAEEANRAKSRFLAAASHDLRQPMHALGLFVSAMKPHVTGEQGPRILERVESTVRSTEAMFNAMLDVSRLDAGVLVPDVKPFPLAPLLTRLAAEYAPRAEAKGLRLKLRVREHNVLSDPTLLERVIRNYLGNAVRYTQRGGMLLATRKRGTVMSIELWDTGDGIPKDNLGDVYKEFYQLGNPERDRAKGLGLGLAIVKRIAQLLDHPIKLASSVGHGSKFSIEVPLAPSAACEAAGEQHEKLDETLLVGACVLVIDDEADAREAVEVLLKQWGCLVLTAESAQQARELLRQQDASPDVLLSDYRLREGSTGIDAIRAIRTEFGAVPAALITGDTAPDRLKEAAASGHELLHKPLNALRLKAVLCRMLG